MLDVMRKTVHKENDLLDGGLAQDVFEGMLYDEYAKKMAADRADSVLRKRSIGKYHQNNTDGLYSEIIQKPVSSPYGWLQ